jgi:hypothetical protein
MTSTPAPDALDIAAPLYHQVQARLERAGLAAVLAEVTQSGCDRVTGHLGDPTATASRAAYAAWLRRQVRAWRGLPLPTRTTAAYDWPLTSVGPECLDVLGLLVADLRELAPGMRPTLVPSPAACVEPPQPGDLVAAAYLCVRLAAAPASLLGQAQALTAGVTHLGPATRYLTHCANLAERAHEVPGDVNGWAGTTGPEQVQLAVFSAERLAARLVSALDSPFHAGW